MKRVQTWICKCLVWDKWRILSISSWRDLWDLASLGLDWSVIATVLLRCRDCLALNQFWLGLCLFHNLCVGEWLRYNGKSSLSTSNEQESTVFRNNKSEHWLNEICSWNIDSLKWRHKRKVSDHQVTLFGSVNQFLHEISILNNFWSHDLTGLFKAIRDDYLRVFEVIKILAIYWEWNPHPIKRRKHCQTRERLAW